MEEIYIKISQNHDGHYTLNKLNIEPQTNTLKSLEETYLIEPDKPNTLWNVLYFLCKLPAPKLPPDIPKIPMPKQLLTGEPPNEKKEPELDQEPIIEEEKPIIPRKKPDLSGLSELEKELTQMKAKQIIDKVYTEKGIAMDIDLKSKKLIIKKALEYLS